LKKESVSSSALSTPVGKDSVVLLVLERIKEALIHNELRPGDFLPSEDELTRNLGVGKSSVREAVKMLQAMGIVEVRRGQGTVIRENFGEDMLNPLVFRLIVENADISDLVDLRMMFEAIEKTVRDFENVIARGVQTAQDDIAFHMAILASTHNPLVIRIGETILSLFEASISRSMREIPDTALADHKRILDAFKSRDAENLQAAIVKSFEGWRRSLDRG